MQRTGVLQASATWQHGPLRLGQDNTCFSFSCYSLDIPSQVAPLLLPALSQNPAIKLPLVRDHGTSESCDNIARPD